MRETIITSFLKFGIFQIMNFLMTYPNKLLDDINFTESSIVNYILNMIVAQNILSE